MPQVLLTRNELRNFFPEDPRTVIARHSLQADAVILTAGREVLVYDLNKVKLLADTINKNITL